MEQPKSAPTANSINIDPLALERLIQEQVSQGIASALASQANTPRESYRGSGGSERGGRSRTRSRTPPRGGSGASAANKALSQSRLLDLMQTWNEFN